MYTIACDSVVLPKSQCVRIPVPQHGVQVRHDTLRQFVLISLTGQVESAGVGLPRLDEIQFAVSRLFSVNGHVVVGPIIRLPMEREHRRSSPWQTSGVYAAGERRECQSVVVPTDVRSVSTTVL